MEEEIKQKISDKFAALWAKEDLVFDVGILKDKFDKLSYFLNEFTPFYDDLESEIKSLPKAALIHYEIKSWADTLDQKIEKAKRKKDLSEIGRIFLTHRKKLKARLLEIIMDYPKDWVTLKEEPKVEVEKPLSFSDVFIAADWKTYINALHEVDNPVITSDYTFIGRTQKDKGVICSWIKELQLKGKIYKKYNRQQLAALLNKEIKDLNLGKEGKTFDNVSLAYENGYKRKLFRLTNLSP